MQYDMCVIPKMIAHLRMLLAAPHTIKGATRRTNGTYDTRVVPGTLEDYSLHIMAMHSCQSEFTIAIERARGGGGG